MNEEAWAVMRRFGTHPVRPASVSDIEALLWMLTEDEGGYSIDMRTASLILGKILTPPNATFVIEVGDMPVGMIAVCPAMRDDRRKDCLAQYLFIDKDFRGIRAVMSLLLAAAEYARAQGAINLIADTDRGEVPLYDRLLKKRVIYELEVSHESPEIHTNAPGPGGGQEHR